MRRGTGRDPIRPSSGAGFTLIEVVAALSLTGLLMLTVAGAYFTLSRSLDVLAAAEGKTRERAIYRRIRSDLELAYASPNAALPPFAGEAERLAFAARLGPTGLSLVEYRPGSEGFVRQVTPWTPGEAEEAGEPEGRTAAPRTVSLWTERRVAFRYLSRAGGWSTRWSGEVEGEPPAAVEVRVEASRAGRGPWPALTWVFSLPAGSRWPGEEP